MKIEQPKKFPFKIILPVAGVLVISIVAAIYFAYFNNQSKNSTESSQATNEQIESGNESKSQTVTESTTTKPSNNSDTPVSPAPNGLTVSIPYGDSTRLTVLIDSVISGTCTLKLTDGVSTINKTAEIQAGPTTSTCQGFSYDTLGSGSWTATVTVSSGTSMGTITKNITVQ